MRARRTQKQPPRPLEDEEGVGRHVPDSWVLTSKDELGCEARGVSETKKRGRREKEREETLWRKRAKKKKEKEKRKLLESPRGIDPSRREEETNEANS